MRDSRQNYNYEPEDVYFRESGADKSNQSKAEQSQNTTREEHSSRTNKRKSKFDN